MVTIFEVDLSFLFLTITPFPAFPQGEGASTFPPWGKMKGGFLEEMKDLVTFKYKNVIRGYSKARKA